MKLDPLLLGSTPILRSNYHGSYETLNFVLRLSPVNHELVDEITQNARKATQRHIQAYSTFLHETIHWWQHIGSTAGLIFSLSHPAITHSNLKHLKRIAKSSPPQKSIKTFSDKRLLQEGSSAQTSLYHENNATNNALDVTFFQQIISNSSESLPIIYNYPHFESVGHCYHIAIANASLLVSTVIDIDYDFLPDPKKWENQFKLMAKDSSSEYAYGSGIIKICSIGIKEIFEGQAIFNQIQLIASSRSIPILLESFVHCGMLHGVYKKAFDLYIDITGYEMPQTPLDQKVSLFLLICDISINPNIGIVDEIQNFDRFLDDVDPGRRFIALCRAASTGKAYELIKEHSKSEYEKIESELTSMSGIGSVTSWRHKVSREWTKYSSVTDSLTEVLFLRYSKNNIVSRFCVSHFLRFAIDASESPEFFCWPGIWKAKGFGDSKIEQLWLRHLSVFTDRGDKMGIYPREWPDRKREDIFDTMNNFYGSIIMYDMTHQWILNDGPFNYDYDGLTESKFSEESLRHVQGLFEGLYGVHPDDIVPVATSS